MPAGKGTYGSKKGRPSKKKKLNKYQRRGEKLSRDAYKRAATIAATGPLDKSLADATSLMELEMLSGKPLVSPAAKAKAAAKAASGALSWPRGSENNPITLEEVTIVGNKQKGGYVKGINQMIDDVNIHGNLYKGGKTFKAGTFRSDRKSNRTY